MAAQDWGTGLTEEQKKEKQRQIYEENRVTAPTIPTYEESQPPPPETKINEPRGGGDDTNQLGQRGIKTPINPGGLPGDRVINVRRRYGAGNPAEGVIDRTAWRWGDRMRAAAGRRTDRKNIIADWAEKNDMPKVAEVFKGGAERTGAREIRLEETNKKVATEGWDPGDYWNSFWGTANKK